MLRLQNYPISKKLTAMNMLVSGIALLLACTAFFTYDLLTFRQARVRGLTIQAEIIGSNSVAAILFNDPHSAENTLSALHAAPNIVFAAVYNLKGEPFAAYWRDQPGAMPSKPDMPEGQTETSQYTEHEVTLAKVIIFEGKPVGTVFLRSDLKAIDDRFRRYAIIVAIVLLASLLAALLISRITQRAVSRPIIQLSDTARVISKEQNYSIRVDPGGRNDEVSTLIGAFNEMLEQIQIRDTALQRAQNELEGRVRDRTAELKRAEEGLRTLSTRLLQLQDEERRQIARELHDSTGQVLAALGMNLATIQTEAGKLSPTGETAVTDSIDLVQTTLKELRTISYLLHPPLLDETGLESALRWFVQGFAERSKIPVELDLAPNLGRLGREIETAIFRIVQESLTNIHRHSGSPSAAINLTRNANSITVQIRDRGRGFSGGPPGEVSRPATIGIGIQGMQERARQLGGQLSINTGPSGTVIVATLPVS